MATTSQKILAMILCLALCLSIIPAAFADEGDLLLQDSAVFDAAEGVKATVNGSGCKTIDEVNAAIVDGGIITLVSDDLGGEILISKATTLDLNGHTFSGTMKVEGALSIDDSIGTGSVETLPVLEDGGSLTVYGGIYQDSGISKYVATGYMLKKEGSSWHVTKRTSVAESAIAVVDGTEYYEVEDVNDYLANKNAKVTLNDTFTGDITFQNGGVLDLNGKTLTGNVINRGTGLRIQDSGSTGEVTGKVSNPTGGTITITGGKFASKLSSNYIANGYGQDEDLRVLPLDKINRARIGSTYYPTLEEAVEEARSGDLIVVVERTDGLEDYTVSEAIEKNLSLMLGSNGIKALTVDNAQVSITDGFIRKLSLQNGATVNVSGVRFDAMPTADETSRIVSNVSLSADGIDKHIKNTDDTLSFLCGQALAESDVYVDGNSIASGTNFELSKDKTGITLKADYLNKLTAGTHTLRLLTGRGEYAGTEFEILEASSVSFYNTPYRKGTSSAIRVSPVEYSAFSYCEKENIGSLTEIYEDGFSLNNKTLTLNKDFLNSLEAGTYYLFGTNTDGESEYLGSFVIKNPLPQITKQPASASVADGERVTFSIKAAGENLSYQWERRSSEDDGFTPIKNATATTYSFTAELENNGWQYRCTVTSGEDEVYSEIALLTVELSAPVIVTQPSDQHVAAGQVATFTVKANGGELKYRWFYRESRTDDWKVIKGKTTNELKITATKDKNGFSYYCEVRNDKGMVSSSAAALTVTRPAELNAPTAVSAEENLDGAVVVTWNESDYAQMYRVYRKSADGTDWITLGDTAETSYIDKTAEKGKSYTYVVRCLKSDGTYDSPQSKESNEVTVYGESFTVTFETNGGTLIDPQNVVKNQKAEKPTAPQKGDYWFGGWYTDSKFSNAFSFDTLIKKDTKLYARWEMPSFTAPTDLTEIGEEAFAGIAAAAVKLDEDVTAIGSRAFANCLKLCAIYIPAATKTIADDAFTGVKYLVILGEAGSAAETFAKTHGFDFQPMA